MQINISTRHGQISLATQEKIKGKVSKLAKFYDRVTAFEVTVDLRNEESPNVEIRISAERIPDLVAADSKGNLISSVDSVVHKLEQQIKRQKQKLQNHRGTGRRTEVVHDVDDDALEDANE